MIIVPFKCVLFVVRSSLHSQLIYSGRYLCNSCYHLCVLYALPWKWSCSLHNEIIYKCAFAIRVLCFTFVKTPLLLAVLRDQIVFHDFEVWADWLLFYCGLTTCLRLHVWVLRIGSVWKELCVLLKNVLLRKLGLYD